MIKYLPMFILFAAPFSVLAASSLSGIISSDMTLYKANSPYTITGNVLAEDGVVLTIEPGTKLRFAPGVTFFIEGSLFSRGTAADPILFTSTSANPAAGNWKGLVVRTQSVGDSVLFDHCNFEYAYMAVKFDDASVNLNNIGNGISYFSFTNSTIASCDYALRGGGNTRFTISDNLFKGSEVNFSAYRYVTGNEIVRNEFSNCVLTVYSQVRLSYNYIHDITGGTACYIAVPYPADSMNEISYNRIVNNSHTGIYINAKLNVPMHDNIIAYNGTGVTIHDARGLIMHNTITHNKTGVYMQWCMEFIHFNYNCIDSNAEFQVRNDYQFDHDFQNNYWGMDTSAIPGSLYDFYDDFVTGKIFYQPCLLQQDANCQWIAGPSVTSVPEAVAIQEIAAYPNPVTASCTIKTKNQQPVQEITVYNLSGKKMISIADPAKEETTIDMAQYPAGVYIYQVVQKDNRVVSGRILKQ